MFEVKVQGLDKLRRLRENAASLHGPRTVPMKDVLTDAFMSEHTSHPSWKAFAEASHLFPGDDVSQEAFEMIPDAAWDLWVKSATRFASWKEMLQAAATRYYKHLLFRGV